MSKRRLSYIGIAVTTLFCGLVTFVWLSTSYAEPQPNVNPAPAAQTTTCRSFTSRDVPKDIPDYDYSSVRYVSSKLPVSLAGAVQAVTVTFTVEHTYPEDLNIHLCAPNRSDCLLTDNGLTNDEGTYTVTFSSLSATPLPGDPPYSGAYAAEDPLTRFVGLRASGYWQLVAGDEAYQDVGSITAWSLSICTVSAATPTYTPSPTTPTPQPTLTPRNGCSQAYFVAVDNGQEDPCDCEDPLFEVAPASSSGSNTHEVFDRGWRVCNAGCNWDSFEAHYSVDVEAQGDSDLFWTYGAFCVVNPQINGGDSDNTFWTTDEYYPCSSEHALCWTHDVPVSDDFPNIDFTINGWGYSVGCSALPEVFEWSYDVTFDTCINVGPTPTPPGPTPTPVCLTPVAAGFGWWWSW